MYNIAKLSLQPKDVDTVIYHKNCQDGFCSAYIAWKYNNNITFIPATHGDLPPTLKNKNILICDFSYSKEIIDNLLKENNLCILDHHKSAMEILEKVDDKHKIFDMSHSGAHITWKYFYPDIKIPLLVKYVEDRDIWLKKMPKTNEFSIKLLTVPHTFEEYDKLLNDDYIKNKILSDGSAMVKLNNYLNKREADNASVKFTKINDKYYVIPYLNTTCNKSDIGNILINEMYPYSDFSVVYSIDDKKNETIFSLRSTNKHCDVSAIAKLLGGGGHRNASGIKYNYITNQLSKETLLADDIYNIISSISMGIINGLNVIYVISNVLQKEIGKYLLQCRYNNIQVGASILEQKLGHKIESKFDLVIVKWLENNLERKLNVTL